MEIEANPIDAKLIIVRDICKIPDEIRKGVDEVLELSSEDKIVELTLRNRREDLFLIAELESGDVRRHMEKKGAGGLLEELGKSLPSGPHPAIMSMKSREDPHQTAISATVAFGIGGHTICCFKWF